MSIGTNFTIHDLSYSYSDTPVFEHINETFNVGQMNVLMSPSGSGKSTLLSLIAGILTTQSGRIEYPVTAPRFSMVFQENRLLESQSIMRNLRLVNPALTPEAVTDALKSVGLPYRVDKKVCKLSGGEKRRIAILRALMASYDILLLDEPFTGLDEGNKLLMMEFIKTKAMGHTTILVTHNKEEAEFWGCKISRCLA